MREVAIQLLKYCAAAHRPSRREWQLTRRSAPRALQAERQVQIVGGSAYCQRQRIR